MNDTEQTSLAILAATPAMLRETLGRMPESIVATNLDRDWSPKRILAHVVDVDAPAFADRLRRIVAEDKPSLTSIDAMAHLEESGLMSSPTSDLLDRLERERRETCEWLRTLTDDQIARTATHDSAGKLTASNLLHYWAYHDIAHLRGIQRMVQSVLIHETGGISETMDV